MSSEDNFVAHVYHRKKIQKSKRESIKFTNKERLSIFIHSTNTLVDIQISILQIFEVCRTKHVKKLFYKIMIVVVLAALKNFLEVRNHEFYAKLEDVITSFAGSALNP
ncbi:hypothetical protein Ahy_A09g044941 [Arachis hypogaea]|uniref:Uncharacterized protein n=1 Tax=Arachis hypogaea TaxID=3818 RepID=A0A445BL62_ARAHY|nr:hypothetical protein Ahy_A09g044941 [Arachis hypogaea]